MGLLDDLTPAPRVYPCRVRDVRATLEPDDQTALDAALADPRWKHYTLSKALQAKGLDIKTPALQKHRENNCSCSKI